MKHQNIYSSSVLLLFPQHEGNLVSYGRYEATYNIDLRNTAGCFQHKTANLYLSILRRLYTPESKEHEALAVKPVVRISRC